jgi:cobalt-precorrin 5A hydrolase/precorrin-3B C17-methyltransferase
MERTGGLPSRKTDGNVTDAEDLGQDESATTYSAPSLFGSLVGLRPIVGWVTGRGRRIARRISEALPDADLWDGPLADAVAASFKTRRPLVAVAAIGAVARLSAAWIESKNDDPPVVCIDESGSWVVPLLGGHEGGANRIAAELAHLLQAIPVVTTASDSYGSSFLDALRVAGDFRFEAGPGYVSASRLEAAYLDRIRIHVHTRCRWPVGPLAPIVEFHCSPIDRGGLGKDEIECGEGSGIEHMHVVMTSSLAVPSVSCSAPVALIRPPEIVVGVGFSTDASRAEIELILRDVLRSGGISPLSVVAIATIDRKIGDLDDVGIDGHRPPAYYVPAADLAEVEVPSPSEAVKRTVGVPSVAEASAIYVANMLGKDPELVVSKVKTARVTAAVARFDPKGVLGLVSLGPGSIGAVTPEAAEFLASASHVLGYGPYVDMARPFCRRFASLERYEIGSEQQRAEAAVRLASEGRRVALVSGGDVGIYGMASRALEREIHNVDVVIIPGVSSLQAAAAALGAPLGDDFCCISLSDYGVGWPTIRKRLESAAEAGMVICLFNPSSDRRPDATKQAAEVLLRHLPADTPVGIVWDAWRPGQRFEISSLGRLGSMNPGMSALVIVGNRNTRVIASRLVTSRQGEAASVGGDPGPSVDLSSQEG